MKDSIRKFALLPILGLAMGLAPVSPAGATPEGKGHLGGEWTAEEMSKVYAESFPQTLKARGASPTALPDIFGPGAVLRAGNVVTKVTNIGVVGNPFTNTSSDPSGQWPGQSGIEYMNFIGLAVGGVEQVNGQVVRRVTYFPEWRPASIEAPDKIYSAYEGIVSGVRNHDDDSDGEIDEDFLDGQDNDGDSQIDEDYAAQGQQMFSLVMTDFSPQSLTSNNREAHTALTLRVEQKSWSYSLTTPNLTNFDVLEYTIKNVSGNSVDSLFVGWLVDFDAGPAISSNFFSDDQDIPWYPQGWFIYDWTQGGQILDPRTQHPHSLVSIPFAAESALCQRDTIRINGFSVADDDGDRNTTIGVPSFLLFDYTLDPTGILGPKRVQWRAYRSFIAGTPFGQGGSPSLDIQRFEFMSSTENVQTDETNPMAGFITAEQGDQKGDYQAFVSVGPWLQVPNGASVQVSVGYAVDRGTLQLGNSYRAAYDAYVAGDDANRGAYGKLLLDQYPGLNNAFTAQIAFEGVYELNRRFQRTDFHGRETGLIAPPGQQFTQIEDCEYSQRSVLVTDREYYWFDLDCDLCTGIWDFEQGGPPRDAGYFHKTWNTSSPPPSPITNASLSYNYTDNPNRPFVPGNDNSVTIAWDNLSEISPDPAPPNKFDFRGYKVWKVSDWTRPVGSPGPGEEDWALIAELRFFSYYSSTGVPIANNLLQSPAPCEFPSGSVMSNIPCVFIPVADSNQLVYLERGDVWNKQTGEVIRPDTSVGCRRLPSGNCETQDGSIERTATGDYVLETRTRYQVGLYSMKDPGVKNGFMYFYSVTAFDSARGRRENEPIETESRRSAVEAEGVVPQTTTKAGKSVTVVPNPYRGYANIQQRPSAWDLTPNSTDPTGTHIDFYGMPAGTWTLRIFTISGDLVQVLRSQDAVNESIRSPVTEGTTVRPGFTRQQDTAADGQARWNLISRNGQDIVSGVYLFTVDSNAGIQRGKFVVIR